jgi:hypothetical protein
MKIGSSSSIMVLGPKRAARIASLASRERSQ